MSATERSHASTSSPAAATPAASVTTPCTENTPSPVVDSPAGGRTTIETSSSDRRPLHRPPPATMYSSRFGPVTRKPTASPLVTSALKRRGSTATPKTPSVFVCAVPRLSWARSVNASIVRPGSGRLLRSSNTRPLMKLAMMTVLVVPLQVACVGVAGACEAPAGRDRRCSAACSNSRVSRWLALAMASCNGSHSCCRSLSSRRPRPAACIRKKRVDTTAPSTDQDCVAQVADDARPHAGFLVHFAHGGFAVLFALFDVAFGQHPLGRIVLSLRRAGTQPCRRARGTRRRQRGWGCRRWERSCRGRPCRPWP